MTEATLPPPPGPHAAAAHRVPTRYSTRAFRLARRAGVFVAGLVVLLLSVVLFFVPGHLLLVPVGLSIWAREFPWARRLLDRFRARMSRLSTRRRQRRTQSGDVSH